MKKSTIFSQSLYSIFLLFGLFGTTQVSLGQVDRYNWVSGDNSNNTNGVYGSKGQTSPTSKPGARSGANSWLDNAGNFYAFGGLGNSQSSSNVFLNDLWKWDGSAWTWLRGDSTGNSLGSNGTIGIPSLSNLPSSRSTAASWVDSIGNFWLFGGRIDALYGSRNDLWKWDGINWTWISGDPNAQAASVSSQGEGTTTSGDTPGSRRESMAWSVGNDLYIYGGAGNIGGLTNQVLSDLWKYNTIDDEWTLLKGDITQSNAAIYGTQGSPSATNHPGPRYTGNTWTDKDGNLWLFGGGGSGGIRLQDLWKYDTSTDEWTWVHGSALTNQSGVLSDGDASLVIPGGRLASVTWTDSQGDLWLFAGHGYDEVGSRLLLNDLWRWDGLHWNFEGGSGTGGANGVYNQGSNEQNVVSARSYSTGIVDKNDEVLIFGGGNGNPLNDLWKIEYGYFYEDLGNGDDWEPNEPEEDSRLANVYIRHDFSGVNRLDNKTLRSNHLFVEAGNNLEVAVRHDESRNDICQIHGNLIIDGTISDEGQIVFTGGKIHEILGDANFKFYGAITLDSNSVLKTNNKLTLGATADTYGRLSYTDEVNEVLDSISMEKWLDLQGSSDNAKFFYLSSPFEDVKIKDFDNGGYFKLAADSTTTVYKYVPVNGWQEVSNGNDKGPAAFYAGQGSGTTFLKVGGEAGVITVKGTLGKNNSKNQIGDFYYTDGQHLPAGSFFGTSVAETEGWNFLAHDFPSNYDLIRAFEFSLGVNHTAYVWNGSDYSTFTHEGDETDGNATNGGSRFIKPFEAFFIQLDAPYTNNSLVPLASAHLDRSIQSRTPFKNNDMAAFKNASNRETLRIFLKNKNGKLENDAVLGFDEFATEGFDGKMDAWKLFGNKDKGALYSRSSNLNFAVNFLSKEKEFHEIPLHVDFDTAHGQNLVLDFDLENLEHYKTVWLEDIALSKLIDLNQAASYSFNYDSTAVSPRFKLHFSHNSDGLDQNKLDYYWYKNKNQEIELVFIENQTNTKVKVFEASGKLIAEKLINGQKASIPQIKNSGLYILQIEALTGSFSQKIIN